MFHHRVARATVVTVVGATAAMGVSPTHAEASSTVFQKAIDALTDTARAAHGCKPLKLNSKLNKSAQSHANEMSKYNYFEHSSRDGTSWSKRIKKAGFNNPGGENIAYGYPTAVSVVQAWMASPGHRANILDCQFKYIGVGYAAKGDYWVQDFGYKPI